MKQPTIQDFLSEKIIYDKESQMIFSEKKNGHWQLIVGVRGWGAIQNLFKFSDGKIDLDCAYKFQDELGQFVADAIQEKLNTIKP